MSTTTSSTSSSSSSTPTSTPETPTATALQAPMACNNSPLLCDRQYNHVAYLGTHNSPFVRDYSAKAEGGANQDVKTTESLSAGVRLLTAAVHFDRGHLYLCHGRCWLQNRGNLADWLVSIKEWLDANPNEVVTLVLNSKDDVHVEFFDSDFRQAGVDTYSYIPPASSATDMTAWPTLKQLIEDNTRLVAFVGGIRSPSADFGYLLDLFQFVFQTPWENLVGKGFNCNLDRPDTFSSAADAISAKFLPMLNHFTYHPIISGVVVVNEKSVEDINSPSNDGNNTQALGFHARQCQSRWANTKPVFVLVDFFNRGSAITTVDRINAVEGTIVGRAEPVIAAEANGASALSVNAD
ncbi:PLC-like phosphodiesterase [Coniochaeta sp. 2T2.1]|nr:PLC-like phosphodiesterase [Coniochaeta sp. 2T2.1]